MSRERLAGTLLFTLAGLVLAAIGIVLAAAPPEWSLRALVGDDAGYYFTIARNHALGHGFSYDRLHETNGFNPLFPWILIAAFQALPAGLPLTACYRVGVLIGFAAMVVALIAWLRILAAAVDPRVFPDHLRHLVRGAAAAFFVLFVATKGY
ncbi:MAG TPA: hypothetical protein VJY35_16225, partial [Candidatus Eisenbacteria bacterium]|nr:hypothetical protein [Candidatus Eisenbacteria bacterium]